MEQNNTPKTQVYNVIIMDRSGSMWSIARSAVAGYNEVLGGVNAAAEQYKDTQDHHITLVLFDSTEIRDVYWNADPAVAEHLTDKTYIPGASTPLYDAVGRTLTRLENEIRDQEKTTVVVTVITDGLENASREYTGKAIKGLVEHLKELGWSFAYMGTDHDVDGVTMSLSITNVIKFEKTEADTIASFKKESAARHRWFKKEHDHEMACPEASKEELRLFHKDIADKYYDEN